MKHVRATAAAFLAAIVALTTTTPANAALPSKYATYDAYFNPDTYAYPYAGSPWVPQGVTNWGTGKLVVSYYYGANTTTHSILVVTDLAGRRLKTFHLGFHGHVGGVAKTANYLWVANEGFLYRYAASDLTKADGATLTSQRAFDVKGNASYAFAQGENVWVGDFNWDTDGGMPASQHNCPELDDYEHMYRYAVPSSGVLGSYAASRVTPGAVQGVVIYGSKTIWSTSCGRTNDSTLVTWNSGSYPNFDANWNHGTRHLAPPMSEGLALTGTQVHQVYESGSSTYPDGYYRQSHMWHGSLLPY